MTKSNNVSNKNDAITTSSNNYAATPIQIGSIISSPPVLKRKNDRAPANKAPNIDDIINDSDEGPEKPENIETRHQII